MSCTDFEKAQCPSEFNLSIRMGRKGEFTDYECSMLVGARRAGLNI